MKKRLLNSREEKNVVGGTDVETAETAETAIGGFSSTSSTPAPAEVKPAVDMVKPKKEHFWSKWFKKKDKKVDETKKIEL